MRRVAPVIVAALLSSALLPAAAASAGSAASGPQSFKSKRVCSATHGGTAACHAHIRVTGDGRSPAATVSYQSGYTPAQLQKAYNVPQGGTGTIVAVVDAYANPNAASDLAAYRAQFGLGTAPLNQYSQTGGPIGSVPANVSWGQEESLDLDMVSAICPACTIDYVGANSASMADLSAAVRYAHDSLHANVITNSYGSTEFSAETSYVSAYSYTDAVVTASSGDSGYGAQFPAAAGSLVAVGGTSLKLNADGSRSSETAWSGGGSGCSAYVAKPSWQHDTLCSRRTIVDIAADADPNTGVAVYDSYGSKGGANWLVFGGTSVAAPLVGAYYAAAGIPAGSPYPVAATYAAPTSLFDVTSGSNGSCGRTTSRTYYLCHARKGYDGPTGLGTPLSATGF